MRHIRGKKKTIYIFLPHSIACTRTQILKSTSCALCWRFDALKTEAGSLVLVKEHFIIIAIHTINRLNCVVQQHTFCSIMHNASSESIRMDYFSVFFAYSLQNDDAVADSIIRLQHLIYLSYRLKLN